MLKEGTYINIQSFMVTKLGLSGNDLLVYAIIYGFSQDGDSVFKGTRSYIAEWCNCSVKSVQRSLKSLMDAGHIVQVYHSVDNYQVHYKAVTPWDKNEPRDIDGSSLGTECPEARDKMSQDLGTKCPDPRDKMSHIDKLDNNIDKDNLADKEEEEENLLSNNCLKPARGEIEDFISEHCPHIDAEGFYKYYDARGWQINGKPITDWRALANTWEKKMQADTQKQISVEDQIKLFANYKKKFGRDVPPEYLGNYKRIQLAIATDTPI